MTKHLLTALPFCAIMASPALAGEKQTVHVLAETRNYSDGYGELNTVTAEYTVKSGDTIFVFEPAWGERKSSALTHDAVSLTANLYHRFSDDFTTRTRVSISENEPVFANRDIAQDFTFRVLPRTTATIGGRWARYYGGTNVYTASAGVRYYFRHGAISYRLSYVEADRVDPIVTHLVNLVVNDPQGDGKTQLWLSAGGTSLENSAFTNDFSGDDYSVYLRRYQPVAKNLDILGSVGFASYDRPHGRISAPIFGLGVQVSFGGDGG